ncbi:ABC transporter substrate-binding protein [Arthrobacter burdickii]|uniref:ABC transporter substrate-binding protein n=1 Tax=Arthrobacter burdickii TaxID=3035920 RepID=A0ABT8JXH0_9MICC|nr:ABC transporter substrate-binding protein [Arthrobacter burdickii]MDN4609865.1 ABC transporter substrate-binding protein [Arthrobacter burdickii]
MQRTRAQTALMVPVTVLALALSACGGSSGTGSEDQGAGTQKDTLTLGQTADIEGYNITLQPSYQGWFGDAVWDTLLTCDELNNPSPQIAESWEISDDSTSATLKIREGQTFSDDTEIDAADIQASGELIATVNARFEGVKYDIADPNTITLTWPEPQAVMISRLCELGVTSSEAIEGGHLDETPVSSGPYELDAGSTTRGSTYTLTKREDYWDSETYPYQNLVLKVLESETAGINALKTGQIDGVLASAATIDEVKASGQEAITLSGATTRLLITDHKGESIPALGDVRVRQAMNMVFDRDAIAKQLYRGYATPAYQIFREGTDAYIEGLEDPYPYDVEKAKQLMEEAGYADGFDLQIPSVSGQNHDLLIPYIAEALGKINIKVTETPLTGPDAISNLLSGTYPVPLWQLGNYGDSRQDIVDYILPSGIWNVLHQEDPKVADLWNTVLTGTEEESAQAQKDINQYVIDQAWFVPMAYPNGFYAYNPEVKIPHVSDFANLHPLLRDFQK